MQKINFYAQFPEAFKKLGEIEALTKQSTLSPLIIHMVKLRASQINGCAFCVDMHVKEARLDKEKELRLHHVAVWPESPLFTPKEKAALLWTESVTKLSQGAVKDKIFAEVKEHFSEKELVELTMVIAMINVWNRCAAPFAAVPGSSDKAYGLDKAGL